MYRFVLRPKWIAFHLLVVLMVFVMVNLAFWQLHRLQDKRAFNDEVRTRTAMAVVPFDAVVTDAIATVDDADQVEWRPVELQGTYLADEQVIVVNRAQEGVVGENVVTPMQLDDGTVVLVNRGFVAAADPVPAPPEGVVQVIGRVRATQQRGFGGLTDPAEGELTEVQRIDIERLAEQLPAPVAPVYIDLLTSQPTTADGTDPAARPRARRRSTPVVHDPVVHLLDLRDRGLGARRPAQRPEAAHPSSRANAAGLPVARRRRTDHGTELNTAVIARATSVAVVSTRRYADHCSVGRAKKASKNDCRPAVGSRISAARP